MVVKAGHAPLMLGHHFRLEAGQTIVWDIQVELAAGRQDLLRTAAIAVIFAIFAFICQMMAKLGRQHALASIFLSWPAKPFTPRIDSASFFSTWASNWSIKPTGKGYAAICFLRFFVVITSVMEQSFRHYFMTPFHTENLAGSTALYLYPFAVFPSRRIACTTVQAGVQDRIIA